MIIGSIVIRCYEFEKMKQFWQDALHYVPKYPPTDDWMLLTDPENVGPNIGLQKIDDKKETRSHIHLDLYADNQKMEVDRLLKIGAKSYPWRYEEGHDYIVLEDPDGNLFCVVQK